MIDKLANPTVQLLALALLALAGQTGGSDLVWTRVVGFAVVAALAIPWLARLLRRFPVRAHETVRETWIPSQRTMREFWAFTGPRALGQIAQVGIQRVDIVLVALWVGPSEAAVYAAATRFLIFGQLAGNAIGTAVQPRISALAVRHDLAPLQDLYRVSTAWIVFATWPFYLTFIVQADWLMRLFGSGYEGGAIVLQVLSCAMLVATACGAVDAVLLMAGKSILTMINAWVALALNIGLCVWLIPQLGILGAAFAWVAAILASNVVPLIQVRAGLGVHPLGRITVLAAGVPALLFGLIPWLVEVRGGGLPGAIVTLVLSSGLYAALIWRWRGALGMVGLFKKQTPAA